MRDASIPSEATTPSPTYVPLLAEGPALCQHLVGIRPHRATLFRWSEKGSHGVVLETLSVGRTRVVSEQQLLRFFAQVAEARRQKGEPQPKPRQRRRRSRTRKAEASA